MFKRKLYALEYTDPENFSHDDESKLRVLVSWLEDMKIRHYKIEDRQALRNIQNDGWNKAFEKFLSDLGCPYQADERSSVVDWLLGYAVHLEFGDEGEKYRQVTPEQVKQRAAQKSGNSNNPLDALDFNSDQFKAGVTSLAMLLQMPSHPDHLEQLKAISILIQEKFSQDALNAAVKVTPTKDEYIPLEKTDLGFEAGDYIMTDAAKILRLLHIRDLRDLQTKINSAIVAVQEITANPKTDSRLGKVGF